MGGYDIYPAHDIGEDCIFTGYESLAKRISSESCVLIDGYVGVYFHSFKARLDLHLKKIGINASWVYTGDYYKSTQEIDELVSPFLGGDDPLFGKKTTLNLADFFDDKKIKSLNVKQDTGPNIIYGEGASLSDRKGFLIYMDLPKNELQQRAKAGRITNLGASIPTDHKRMYKRFYFVDWVILNRHKQSLLNSIDILLDGQQVENPAWMSGNDFRRALKDMAFNVFRVRPWFEPGAWGGQWIKKNLAGLDKNKVNYAWSFELIVPENGLIVESSGNRVEFSFDFLMYSDHKSILGRHSDEYGFEFPIRFDFLDTMDGGNLSIQCHPQLQYIREHFGESMTQEETYYILDAEDDAVCYLGFQEDIDPGLFKAELEKSNLQNVPIDIQRFIQVHSSSKHDLFLIPPGTIHGSGRNNMVLEISTTPYIFTFKMYDWLRLDLDGKPRPLNIERGMANLDFSRKGEEVKRGLLSSPILVEKGDDWELYELPTHEKHSYRIRRYHFTREITIKSDDIFHVLSLVEGSHIQIETMNGLTKYFSYAETFVIPAAAKQYKVINLSGRRAMLVVAFMK